jgi:hypothetical protein
VPHRSVTSVCHGRDEAAGEVEGQIAQRAEGVLDVLAEDREEEHVPEDVVPAAMEEHRRDPADAPRLGGVAHAVDAAGIERRVEDGGLEVRELVEQPDREVGDDNRHVDDRQAPCRDPVGEREHP